VVSITNLIIMDKISYEDKMWIQSFRGIGFGQLIQQLIQIFLKFLNWNLSSVKAICLSFFIS